MTNPLPMLTSLVRLPVSSEPAPTEDIFSSSVGLIFTDDLRTLHGDPGSTVIYKSRAFGDLELSLVDPVGEDERRLFAQYLWNSGVQIGEFIGNAVAGDGQLAGTRGASWSVKGQKVLELGAGTGLGGIVSALAGAEEVAITDYPTLKILNNIRTNVDRNVPTDLHSRVYIQGHEWGNFSDDFSDAHANYFTRIIVADCLWMPWQHRNLAQSMVNFLSHENEARVWVVAGFHTGRAKLAPFFNMAVEEGLEVEDIWERDVDGLEREWQKERDSGGEDVAGWKKWLVVATLRRASRS